MTIFCAGIGGDMHDLAAGTLPGDSALSVPMREILDVPFESECELTFQQPDPATAVEIEWHAQASIAWKEKGEDVQLDVEVADSP